MIDEPLFSLTPSQQRVQELLLMIDETVPSPEVMDELYRVIEHNPEARAFYIQRMHMQSMLKVKFNEKRQNISPILALFAQRTLRKRRLLWVTATLIPVLFLALGLGIWRSGIPLWSAASRQPIATLLLHRKLEETALSPAPTMIKQAASKRAGAIAAVEDWQQGQNFFAMETVSLGAEILELQMASGARVILKGPGEARLIHANRIALTAGEVVVDAGDEVKNFIVELPQFEVVDLGTRFGIQALSDGQAEVHVFQGEVSLVAEQVKKSLVSGRAVTLDKTAHVIEEQEADADRFQATYPILEGIDRLQEQIQLSAAPPQNVRHGAWTQDDFAYIYAERRLLLTEKCPISFDQSGLFTEQTPREQKNLPAGTAVNCYMLHYNTASNYRGPARISGTITFRNEILGLIVDDRLLDATDSLLGISRHVYPAGEIKRGTVEVGDVVEILPDQKTIKFSIQAGAGHLDSMRILTRIAP